MNFYWVQKKLMLIFSMILIGNKKYNESVNEGMTKYNIRLTKTPGWYGIWDKNGKQKAEGEKKYIIKFLKSLKIIQEN